jgi:hypothetical protein
MESEKRPTSFWQTLPGILTAIAAILTAVTGLVVALHESGLFASTRATPDTTTVQAASATHADSQPAAAGSVPWSRMKAVLTPTDGAPIELDAPTLSNCISVSHTIDLDNGASIAFESMRRLEILSANAPTVSNSQARVRVTLRDGKVLEGSMSGNCDIFGYSGDIRYSKYPNKIRRIDFR